MEKELITFKGISRNTDSGISSDGYCAELINGRVAGGSIVPTGKPVIKRRFDKPYDKIFKHTGSGFENLICVYDNNIDAHIKQEDGTYRQSMILKGDSEIKSIESIGNTLSAITSGEIIYFLFKNGEYYNIGSQPEMPIINFLFEGNGVYESEEIRIVLPSAIDMRPGGTYILEGDNKSVVSSSVNGTGNLVVSKVQKEGYFVSPVIVRYTIRMYDGSYIKHSPPVLLLTPNKDTMNFVRQSAGGEDHTYYDRIKEISYRIKGEKYSLNYKIYNSGGIESWKDLIASVDVFISRPVLQYDLNKEIDVIYNMDVPGDLDGGDMALPHIELNQFGEDKIKEKILNESSFYLVRSFSVNEITSDNHVSSPIGSISKEGVLDNLEQKEELPDDDYTNNEITGEVSFVYNARLHLAKITKKIFGGYDGLLFFNLNKTLWNISNFSITTVGYILTDINTEQGRKTVKADISYQQATGMRYGITPYLSYPDIRATKMTIVLGFYPNCLFKEFPLKPHPFLNLAYYLEELKAITIDEFSRGEPPAYEIDNTEKGNNVIRVSEVNNPFYFPAKNTYTPSAYEVVAMCSNTEPVSTGQFGQYPLYVFCKDGIYSLSVDASGETTYNISSPVSRDVCVNPNVCPLDKAVAFITDAGLMIVSGGTTTLLSQEIDGWLPTLFKNNPAFDKILKIGKLENSKSVARFRDFIRNATTGFMYEERELIVSNPDYDYSYVYSFNSGYWSKISKGIDYYVKTYPECWGAVKSEGSSCIYNMYNPGEGVNNIALITRPVKLGSLSHKRLYQFSLRCLLHTARGQLKFRGEPVLFRGEDVFIFGRAGFYVLGSNDAEHFEVIGGKDNFYETRDIIANMNRSKSYKYFIFCLSGNIRTTSFINNLELMVDTSFTNRIR
ncbi:MAG: hypothetical protein LBU37_10355 [Tannerellaceae bacterium]|jgi:hypothetical protein|nr:hypothetical protein [Tannerellaceae bacterium]